MRPLAQLLGLCAMALLHVACASTQKSQVLSALEARRIPDALGAYERMRESEGADPSLLARIAALVLEEEALEGDASNRAAAFAQLTAAGTSSHAALRRLADNEAHPNVSAQALAVLASQGDASAKASLRALLGAADAEIHAASLASLDVVDDAPLLVEALAHSSGEVRLAAANHSARGTVVPELFLALADAARNDPLPGVRAACVRALGHAGEQAVDILRERLSDPNESVRMSSVGALASADRVRARDILASLLSMGATSASIEAARVLAMPAGGDDRGTTDARAFLLRGLLAPEASIRSQAAVALAGLPADASMNASLLTMMEDDSDPNVRMLLASTLISRAEASHRAHAVLHALLEPFGMTALQAAALLAKEHDRDAMHLLAMGVRDSNAAFRRVSGRAVAREALLPDLVRRLLADPDASVRIATAGAMVSAESAR